VHLDRVARRRDAKAGGFQLDERRSHPKPRLPALLPLTVWVAVAVEDHGLHAFDVHDHLGQLAAHQRVVNQGLLPGAARPGVAEGLDEGAGALAGSADYDAFGAVRASSGASSTYGYTGEQFDGETGFTYLRARYLNPVLGRFTSADSVQPNASGSQGFNLYTYVANNPTTWIDPTGHFAMALGGMAAFANAYYSAAVVAGAVPVGMGPIVATAGIVCICV